MSYSFQRDIGKIENAIQGYGGFKYIYKKDISIFFNILENNIMNRVFNGFLLACVIDVYKI
jgi:hypothetical protein